MYSWCLFPSDLSMFIKVRCVSCGRPVTVNFKDKYCPICHRKYSRQPPLALLLPVLVLDKVQKYFVGLPHHVNFLPLDLPLAFQFPGLPGALPGYQALDGPDDIANDDV